MADPSECPPTQGQEDQRPDTGHPSSPPVARPVRDGVLLGAGRRALRTGLRRGRRQRRAVASGRPASSACSPTPEPRSSRWPAPIAGGGSLLAGSIGPSCSGSRNALYSLRLADLLRVRGLAPAAGARHGVTDESTRAGTVPARPGNGAGRIRRYLREPVPDLERRDADRCHQRGPHRLASSRSALDVIGLAAFLALIWPRLAAGGVRARRSRLSARPSPSSATPLLPTGSARHPRGSSRPSPEPSPPGPTGQP